MPEFRLHSKFQPTGDQPAAIAQLTRGLKMGIREQTLLGVTGSGKTFTMANLIANIQKPTLILAHNKTLAAQLYSEFREFFPENEVHYFVSYFDYYQPEAYIPTTDTYIEKDSAINDEIDKLHSFITHASRHYHRGFGFVYLWYWFAGSLHGNVPASRENRPYLAGSFEKYPPCGET